MSFGFRHGIPVDADLVFDVRFLPNPYFDPQLRALRGIDEPVAQYVLEQEDSKDLLDRLMNLLAFLLPRYRHEPRQYLTIAVGCTGGHHRSVAIAEELHRRLASLEHKVRVYHRDIER